VLLAFPAGSLTSKVGGCNRKAVVSNLCRPRESVTQGCNLVFWALPEPSGVNVEQQFVRSLRIPQALAVGVSKYSLSLF
jgi:hypothetical protein